ncbi:MAG: GerMN domain-containing protein [Clostridia bacterium]|nr:GerMN domain-containing protein [Clostridia bacterium]
MNKKTKKIAIILITTTISISLVFLVILNVDIKKIDDGTVYNEIVPEEEITDNQLRETTMYLYYVGDGNELKEVVDKVDSKELMENPYLVTLNRLINNNNEVNTCIPNNVRINNLKRDGECLIIDLSKEFINNMDEDTEKQGLAISQIVNTMTQFTEINAVKILIDGSDECSFKNGNINFKQLFTNED